MKLFHLLLLIFVFGSNISKILAKGSNYCSLMPCNDTNIACGNFGNLSDACFPNARLSNMAKYRNMILNAFNSLRNAAAGGQEYSNLPAAARMAKMSWSTELEYFAKLDVSRCRLEPRRCMCSKNFYYIGTIVDKFRYNVIVKASPYAIIEDMVKKWGSGASGLTRRETLKLPDNLRKEGASNAALLLSERNSRVGCSLLRYEYEHKRTLLFSCAFATDNLINKPIYKWGLSPGKSCKRRDSKYRNLCATGENYDNHKRMNNAEVYVHQYERRFYETI